MSLLVAKSEGSSGLTGNAHFYKIYFVGEQLHGDVDQIEPQHCSLGVPLGMDSTNSRFHIRTLIQGGKTEHQQVSLASDAGTTNDTPAFQLTISDSDANSWTSPCYSWGVQSLDLAAIIDTDAFSTAHLTVSGVIDLSNSRYEIESLDFVEGVVVAGDLINPGKHCMGHVLSIEQDGKSLVIEASSGCSAVPGDALYVQSDIAIIDSFTDNGSSMSELTVLSSFADSEVESDDELFKIRIEFDGVTRSTSCLHYGVSAEDIQHEIGTLFDFNLDGLIDSNDANHVRVTRQGDGSSASGFGYTYEFSSSGSPTLIGPSQVLGSHAPKLSVVDIGSDGGCADSGVEDILVTTTASTSDNSNTILLGPDATVAIQAGSKVRMSSSLVSTKVYTVDHTSLDGNTLVLSENFRGSTTGAASLYLMRGGIPQFDVQIVRDGLDEFVYDIFFTGAHWRNVPQIQVNQFGDGSCAASFSDIADGMNRNIGIRTLSDGGGMIDADSRERYVLDRNARRGQSGTHDLYVVPPIFSVHSDSSEVQRIFVFDDDSTVIWSSGQPSYKLSFGGEDTACIDYDALDAEVEAELNSLSSLCPVNDNPCVTVTRERDSIRAPSIL